jgi:hypothetical protein
MGVVDEAAQQNANSLDCHLPSEYGHQRSRIHTGHPSQLPSSPRLA